MSHTAQFRLGYHIHYTLEDSTYETQVNPLHMCSYCGDDVGEKRYALGYRVCLFCGEEIAKQERKAWCVAQEYGKGNYQYITRDAAPTTLRETNQKNPR